MPTIRVEASYPGVGQVISATYTLSHGISPGVAVVEMAPQADFEAAGGDLSLGAGAESVTFADCKVDRHSIRTNEQGQVVSLAVVDRRWKWSFGAIQGHYNVRRDDGSIDPDTQADPQQLASLCLDAMGELGYDVSDLPTAPHPLCQWEAENPAQALQAICDQLGYRVVLQLDGTVKICKLGVGAELPVDGSVIDNSLTIDPPERPDSIQVVCGRTRYQADLLLEAVGQDVDGGVYPIDQLSYKPAAGWGNENPRLFAGVSDTPDPATGAVPRELARETVYRWYQITEKNPRGKGFLTVPGYPLAVTNRKQLLPIEDVLVDTFFVNGVPQPAPALIFGSYWDGGTGYANTAAGTWYRGDFEIDKDKGIVKFRDYMVQTVRVAASRYQFTAASLGLRVAVSVKDPTTSAWDRHLETYVYPGQQWGTGSKVLFHDEINLNIWPTYDKGNKPVAPLNTNLDDVTAQCQYYIRGADLEYQTNLPYEINYAGIKSISPDGAVQQVTWSVGMQGATTRASRNDETKPFVPDYKERRFWERLRGENTARLLQLLQAERARKGQKKR